MAEKNEFIGWLKAVRERQPAFLLSVVGLFLFVWFAVSRISESYWTTIIFLMSWPVIAIIAILLIVKMSEALKGVTVIAVLSAAIFAVFLVLPDLENGSGPTSSDIPAFEKSPPSVSVGQATDHAQDGGNGEKEAVVQQETTVPQFSFDIPGLIGKDIDEVRAMLGTPSSFHEPTKKEISMFPEQVLMYEKDGNSLLVHYDYKTRTVAHLDFGGAGITEGESTNESTLLTLGNLKRDDPEYSLNFVKDPKDSSRAFSVQVIKKLPMNLDGEAAITPDGIKIQNHEIHDWINCDFKINPSGLFNNGYVYSSSLGISAKGSATVPFSEFTKDGKRFNYYLEKPESLFVGCYTYGQRRSTYYSTGN
ncbi:MAG: hypothetical protein HGA38_03115 [Candidatus Moranbacteria bacterium]|nr:hypothetical protein [Candidatus Moranbacteria bacterium]